MLPANNNKSSASRSGVVGLESAAAASGLVLSKSSSANPSGWSWGVGDDANFLNTRA